MIKGLRPKETFEDATRAYQHQHLVTFPNRVAVQALASVEMSRVVQQDLEQISRNAHLEHERQGQLLALGRAGVPHHIAEALPTQDEPSKEWGIGKALKALSGGFRRAVGGTSDDSTTVAGGGTGASSSGYTPSVDRTPTQQMQAIPEEVVAKVIDQYLQKLKEKEQEADANKMDVDEVAPPFREQAHHITQVFQNFFDNRQLHLTIQQFEVMVTQNINYIIQQYTMGVSIEVIMNRLVQQAQPGRSDVQTIAVDENGRGVVGPALPVTDPLVKVSRPRRMGGGHAIMGPSAAAASDEGAGTLDTFMRPGSGGSTGGGVFSKAQAKPKPGPSTTKKGGKGTRTSSEGATLVTQPGKFAKNSVRGKAKGSQDKPDDE